METKPTEDAATLGHEDGHRLRWPDPVRHGLPADDPDYLAGWRAGRDLYWSERDGRPWLTENVPA